VGGGGGGGRGVGEGGGGRGGGGGGWGGGGEGEGGGGGGGGGGGVVGVVCVVMGRLGGAVLLEQLMYACVCVGGGVCGWGVGGCGEW